MHVSIFVFPLLHQLRGRRTQVVFTSIYTVYLFPTPVSIFVFPSSLLNQFDGRRTRALFLSK